MSKIRVGMIGVGGIAQGHVERLGKLDDVEIVAMADASEASIAKTREHNGAIVANAKAYADYKDMLAQTKVDATVICTPHTQHFAQAADSLAAGAHVLIEKPMCSKVSEAQELLKLIEKTGKVVGLAYQRHGSPQFRYIREQILSGKVGKVQAINALQQQDWKKFTTGTWRQDPALSGGGQINDSGSHLLDIVLWTTGLAPEAVAAFMDNKGTQVDINSAVTVKFVGGAMGTLSIVGDAPNWWEDITIWCERGSFYVRNGHDFMIQVEDGSFITPDISDLPEGTDVDTNFIRTIQGTEEIAAPPICGLRTIELTQAAWESGAAGGRLDSGRAD